MLGGMSGLLDRRVRLLRLPYRLWMRLRVGFLLGPRLLMLNLRMPFRSLRLRPWLRFLMGHRMRFRLWPRLWSLRRLGLGSGLLGLRVWLFMLLGLWPRLCTNRILWMRLRPDQVGCLVWFRLRLRMGLADGSRPACRMLFHRPRLCLGNPYFVHRAIRRRALNESGIRHSPNRRLRRRSMKRRSERTIHRNRLRLPVIDIEELCPILPRLTRMHRLRRQRR